MSLLSDNASYYHVNSMATESAAAATETSLLDEQRDVARSRILKAAQRVLAARGLAATVEDVAEKAGVSRRTVFRHFATRERLFAAAVREGLRTYGEQLPSPPAGASTGDTEGGEGDGGGDIGDWLVDVLVTTHRINARNGRIYWDLSVLDPELSGEMAEAAVERRDARRRFVRQVSRTLWRARGGAGNPPAWLTDATAVHLSGFTTQSLAGDFDRSPEDVARVSARVLEAAVQAALIERTP